MDNIKKAKRNNLFKQFNKYIYYFVVIVLIFLCGFFISNSNVFADSSSSNTIDTSNSNEEINITIPSEIKITLNSDGTNTVPSNYTVINDSIYKINLDNVEMTGANNWKLLNSNVDVKTIKKDTKKVKFYVNDTLIQPKNSSNNVIDESSNGSSSIALDENKNKTIDAYSSSKIRFNIERGAYSKDISTEKAFVMVLNFNIQDLSNNLNIGSTINSLIPDDTTRVEFVTENPGNPKNLSFELIDLSVKQDMGIVGWPKENTKEDGTTEKIFKISSRRKDKKIIFNYESSKMFYNKSNIKEINFNNQVDTSNCASFWYMFKKCSNLNSINVSSFNVSNADSFDGMFANCPLLKTIDISNFKTAKSRYFGGMFQYCSNLEEIIGIGDLDMSRTKECHAMFKECYKLKELNLSTLNTSAVQANRPDGEIVNPKEMFQLCYSLEKITLGGNTDLINPYNILLPTPSNEYIDSADGYWYDIETNERYLPSEIPNNHAATYVAKRYTITYDNLEGGTNSSNNPTYAANGLTKDLTIEPVTANKTGYTFSGWTCDQLGINTPKKSFVISANTINQNITLKANWTINTYTNVVRHWLFGFKNGEGNNGGEKTALPLEFKEFQKKYNETYSLGENDTIDLPHGINYDNYITMSNGLGDGTYTVYKAPHEFTQKNDEMNFQYNYYPTKYNIKYNLNGGTNNSENPSTYSVLYGATFKNPTRVGYDFAGWSYSGDADTSSSSNILNQYKVNNNSNVLFNSDGSITFKAGTTVNNTNILNNTFMQIYNNSKNTVDIDQSVKTIISQSKVGHSQASYYHNWDSGYYKLRIKANGVYEDSALIYENVYFKKGQTYSFSYDVKSFSTDEITCTNYSIVKTGTLTGVNANVDNFNLKNMTKDELYTEINSRTIGDISIQANWTPRNDTKYTINYYLMNKNGTGYDLNKTDVKQGITGNSLKFSSLKETIEGFTYKGIKLNNDNDYIDESIYEGTSITASGSKVINIYYDRNQYYLDLNALVKIGNNTYTRARLTSDAEAQNIIAKVDVYINGNKIKNKEKDFYQTVYYDSDVEFRLDCMPGYQFDGMFTDGESRNLMDVNFNEKITSDKMATGLKFKMPNNKYYIYPILTKSNYSIDTNIQDGNFENGKNELDIKTYNVDSNDIAIQNPTRTGYVFKGWTKEIHPNKWYDGFISFDDGSIDIGTTGKEFINESQYSEYIKVEKGKTYEVSLVQDTDNSYRVRAYDNNLNYIGNIYPNNKGVTTTYTPTEDGYIRILNLNKEAINSKDLYLIEKDNNTSEINEGCLKDDVITKGSTGNIKYVANWFPLASKTESQVGKYVDLDGDGTVDGAIFADLLFGETGIFNEWDSSVDWANGQGKYTIPTITSSKDYCISQQSYTNDLSGTKEVLTPIGSGNDRFYIIALSDISTDTYDWYYSAAGKMTDYETVTSNSFGSGKSNTLTMISKWNNEIYGKKNGCDENHKDFWGEIQTQVNNGWFLPSREEISAFGRNLNITPTNYINKGVSNWYWTSSQVYDSYAYHMSVDGGTIGHGPVTNHVHVRLARIT